MKQIIYANHYLNYITFAFGMKIFEQNSKLKWLLFIFAFALIGYFLWEVNKLISQLRIEEKKKIELWANTISRKS
ncbi:MAG: hypothetical protein KA273_06755, partial [Bacteroidales bacterium]|nr:hypothetical protein [Bacteroidales bacterium]